MKILQIVTQRQYRGAEVFAANLSKELIKLGHSVIFVGLYKNNKDVLVVEEAENKDLITIRPSRFSIRLMWDLKKVIEKEKPDIIQCNGSDTLKYTIGASFFLPKIPILYRNISMISEWVQNGPKKWIYKRFFKRVSHVTSVGEEAIQDFIDTFDYPKEQTTVIRRGIPLVNIDRRAARERLKKQLNIREHDKIIIHVGNMSPEKNHKFLLDLFTELKSSNPELKLVLVGKGVLMDEVTTTIQEKELKNHVFTLGFRKDIPELLAAADCFVLSSLVEGVPGVILEAAAQQTPSIAFNVGGVREVLIDGQGGYVIENFDKGKFKERLLAITKDEALREKLGRKAYELVIKEFNPEKNASKFESLYHYLIVKNKKG